MTEEEKKVPENPGSKKNSYKYLEMLPFNIQQLNLAGYMQEVLIPHSIHKTCATVDSVQSPWYITAITRESWSSSLFHSEGANSKFVMT